MIQIRDLKKVYNTGGEQVHALAGVDIDIGEGEFVAIMGRSGSGKSTLLNILGCMDQPSSGQYLLAGDDVNSLDDDQLSDIRNRRIGFVFQSFHLLPRLSARDNVMLPMRFAEGSNEAETQLRADRLLEQVGLAERKHHVPNEMSGGQCQRVAIARALINHPDILLADEPTGNLDSNTSEQIIELLNTLNNAGQTVIMVTHEPDIAAHADRTIELLDGKVLS